MPKKLVLAAIGAVLAGCATPPPAPRVVQPTLDDYKRIVAKRIAAASGDSYSEPVPEMLKSIVVLEITLDEAGAPSLRGAPRATIAVETCITARPPLG